MDTAGLWALVPLKQVHRGKHRLAAVLGETERRQLIEAMLDDIIVALLDVPIVPRQLLLVSEDEAAARVAARFGIGLYRPQPVSHDPLNAALDEAVAFVAREGGAEVLIVHADLPFAGVEQLRDCIARQHAYCSEHGLPAATLVSDCNGVGTNCLLIAPPNVMGFRFGANSRARHGEACAQRGVGLQEYVSMPIAQDIDTPADLLALVREVQSSDNGCGTRTRALVMQWDPDVLNTA